MMMKKKKTKKVNRYIEIIHNTLLETLTERYSDELTEDNVINIFDVVFESLSYINEKWVDQYEYQEFIDILAKFGNGKNPAIFDMIEKISAYHKEKLEECEKDPNWKKFDNGMDGG